MTHKTVTPITFLKTYNTYGKKRPIPKRTHFYHRKPWRTENEAERDKWYSHVLYSFWSHHFCLDSTFQKRRHPNENFKYQFPLFCIESSYFVLTAVNILRISAETLFQCVWWCCIKKDAFEFQFTIYLTSAAMKANRPLGDQTWVTINVEFESDNSYNIIRSRKIIGSLHRRRLLRHRCNKTSQKYVCTRCFCHNFN